MIQETKQATIKSIGTQITVYKHKTRETWIDFNNCRDEYRPDQLEIKK